jgi:hypothetical protein
LRAQHEDRVHPLARARLAVRRRMDSDRERWVG